MASRAALLLCLAWLVSAPAKADPSITGHRLFNWCSSEQASPLWMLCLDYVAGIADLMALNGPNGGFCPPEDLSDEDKRSLVVTYLQENEERRRASALDLIVASLRQAHPCG